MYRNMYVYLYMRRNITENRCHVCDFLRVQWYWVFFLYFGYCSAVVNFTRHGIYIGLCFGKQLFSSHASATKIFSSRQYCYEKKKKRQQNSRTIDSKPIECNIFRSDYNVIAISNFELQIFELQNRWDGNTTWILVFYATMCVCIAQDNIQLPCSIACHHGYCPHCWLSLGFYHKLIFT